MQPSDENKILDFFATKSEGYTGSSFDSWVQFLLEQTDLNTIRQTQPIYYAASFNMVAILRILTRPELGIDIERRGGRFLSTPLYIAVWRGNWEAAEILLRAGADPLSRDVLTETCYTWAARKGPASLVALMDEILEARKMETYVQVERPLEYRLRSDADSSGKRKNPLESDRSLSSQDAGDRENDT
jgi:ankyrin repeat protein